MSYKTIILGAGESGVGAALLAKAKGRDPFVSDLKEIGSSRKQELTDHGVPFEELGHNESIVLSAEEIIKSPGIPDAAPLIVKARAKGIPVINELEFAARYTDAKLIAITGTNGKTTTTLLTYHLLKHAGLKVGLAGNVGHSLAKQVIEDVHNVYVLEVSSFQLDGMFDFKADIAVLLNITPDHLDRYDNDFQKYVASKFRITQNMETNNSFIYWDDDPVIEKELTNRSLEVKAFPVSINNEVEGLGAYLKGRELVIKNENPVTIQYEDLPLIGRHNLINSLIAISAASMMGLTHKEVVAGLQTFSNAPHRLEKVANIHEVSFVNDSKATNVNAVFYALDGIDGQIVWIAGGVDKGNDYRMVEQLAKDKVKALICLGKENEPLLSFFEGKVPSIHETQDIAEAVRIGHALANSGETVLLSPACASFDLFENYEHRGDRFRDEVLKLKSQNGSRKEVVS